MSLAIARSMLLWCTLINFGLLALWGLLMLMPRGWLHRLWGRWYRISPEQFDTVNFAGILLYEILIFMFNLVPYIALLIVGRE
jgi:hypothetical protein